MKMYRISLLSILLIFFACKSSDDILLDDVTDNEMSDDSNDDSDSEDTDIDVSDDSNPNILLIIADDMGLDASPGYTIGSVKPNMPNLENMIASGITYNNLWSYPTCTPTRASILTGKYGFRTNVMQVDDVLATSEVSIQKYIDDNSSTSYANTVIGKWHLSREISHPIDMGVASFTGFRGGGLADYSNWTMVENGGTSEVSEYTTTKFTDLAIDWVENQTQPWFLWLAYNAPHTPFHLPPTELHSQGALPEDQASIDANPLPYYMAALEAVDTEMGRLLNSMSQEEKDNTIIIFIGDNGTPGQVAQEYNSQRVKGKIYQGGVNVPMVISGAGVSRQNASDDSLINTTDLFATIADLAGSGTTEINDSRSFKETLSDSEAEGREFVYTEVGDDSSGSNYTIRNATHKYIKFSNGAEALYNLSVNPLEQPNLLNANQLPLSAENDAEMQKLITALNSIRN